MNNIDDIKSLIITKIDDGIAQIDVVNEYNQDDVFSSLNRPLVCVFLKKLEVKSSVMSNLLNCEQLQDGVNSTYGKMTTLCIGITIFCSKSNGMLSCNDIFTQIANLLLFDNNLDISQMVCLSTQYKEDCEAFTLDAEIYFNTMLTANVMDNYINDFELNLNINNIPSSI